MAINRTDIDNSGGFGFFVPPVRVCWPGGGGGGRCCSCGIEADGLRPRRGCTFSKIPILRPPLGLSKSGLEDHFWIVPKVVSNQRYTTECRK